MPVICAVAVTGVRQVVSDVGEGAHQSGGRFVESDALRFVLLQVVGNFGVAAEIMDVFQLALGRLHRLAQERKGFQRLIEPFPSLLETILQQHFRACAAVAVVEFGRIDRHRALHLLEQVFVVHDVAEGLVLAVEPVRAADGLEQAVVLHRLVDVEVGAARRIEAGEQLVHDNEQPHVRRLLDEPLLYLILVGFGLGLAGLGIHVLEQRGVGVEEKLLFGLRVRAGFLQRHIPRLRIVRSHNRAPALEHRLLEQLEILRRLVDARRHEHRIAALAGEPRLHAEIEDDILDHPLHA